MKTGTIRLGSASFGALIALMLGAATAEAQSGVYLSGVGFADVKLFDSVEYDPRALIGSIGDTSRDGTAAGGGIRIGTFLHPLWSLEIGVEAEGSTKTEFENPYAILGSSRTSLRIPEISGSTSFLTVNAVVGFHPAKSGRVRLGYLGGVSFVRGTYRTTLPDVQILPAFGEIFVASASGSIAGISSRTITFPDFPITTLSRRDNAVGAILGFEAAIDMTDRIALVPGVRAIVFSDQGQSVFLIRPEVGARWSF